MTLDLIILSLIGILLTIEIQRQKSNSDKKFQVLLDEFLYDLDLLDRDNFKLKVSFLNYAMIDLTEGSFNDSTVKKSNLFLHKTDVLQSKRYEKSLKISLDESLSLIHKYQSNLSNVFSTIEKIKKITYEQKYLLVESIADLAPYNNRYIKTQKNIQNFEDFITKIENKRKKYEADMENIIKVKHEIKNYQKKYLDFRVSLKKSA